MITIHMSTYCRFGAGLLQQAVDSILAQDYRDFELVICDDASADGSAAYLDGVAAADPRVKIVRNDRNIHNNAISLGRCLQASDPARPWVSWMFDDCILFPGALSRLVGGTSNGSIEMIYGVTEVPRRDGSVLRVGAESVAEVRARVARSSVMVPNGGILIRREVFERVGWYDSSIILRRSCDWDLLRRIVEAGVEFAVLPDVLLREHGELHADSLRNGFTTTFDIMFRFAAARDASGARLDLASVLRQPVDWIPPAAWSTNDLALMRYMFLEYFLSVADIPRAFRWARLLSGTLPSGLMRDNLLRAASAPGPLDARSMAAGAFAAAVFNAYREQPGSVSVRAANRSGV